MSKQTDLINIPDAITAAGSNVGIGTAVPRSELDIDGGFDTHIRMQTNSTGASSLDGLLLGLDGSTNALAYFWNYENAPVIVGTNNTERMRIDATGAVTMPHQPAFSVHKDGTNQDNIAVNADVVVTFNDERFDANADFNLGTNSFTAPVTGKYQLSLALRLENIDSAAAYYIPTIVTSNQRYRFVFDPDFGQDQTYWGITISVLADMDASDTAHITIEQGNGNQQTDIQGNAQYTFFTGYLAC